MMMGFSVWFQAEWVSRVTLLQWETIAKLDTPIYFIIFTLSPDKFNTLLFNWILFGRFVVYALSRFKSSTGF